MQLNKDFNLQRKKTVLISDMIVRKQSMMHNLENLSIHTPKSGSPKHSQTSDPPDSQNSFDKT